MASARTKRTPPHDHAARWHKLAASTQRRVLLDLIGEVKQRETLRLLLTPRSKGGRLNRTAARTLLARDRAILDVLRGITDPAVWEEAVAITSYDPLDPKAAAALRKRYAKPGTGITPTKKPRRAK